VSEPGPAGGRDSLSARQRELLDEWLPGARIERRLSWGLVQTTVLEVTRAGERYIVKAGGEQDHHIEREIDAHRLWLHPWTSIGRAPALEFGDPDVKLLVTRYQPGELVLGSHSAGDPGTYQQAGELLALLHDQGVVTRDDYERQANEKSLAWLAGPHRIAPATVAGLRALIASWPEPPAALVPTHGDWQPRNWLMHDGIVAVIDFGRTALRPALTDFARLAAQEFRGRPDLEAAFIAGYGGDPREPDAWFRARVREAIGTAAYACQIGSEPFEAQGHRMIAEVLADS
jgi:Phosphotransferase enzyme family